MGLMVRLHHCSCARVFCAFLDSFPSCMQCVSLQAKLFRVHRTSLLVRVSGLALWDPDTDLSSPGSGRFQPETAHSGAERCEDRSSDFNIHNNIEIALLPQ